MAVGGYEGYIVDDCSQIPHTAFDAKNSDISFEQMLSAKGIVIRPPTLLKKIDAIDDRDHSEYSIYVYNSCGGRVFRYEVRCQNQRINDVRRFLLGSDIGDCWYIM